MAGRPVPGFIPCFVVKPGSASLALQERVWSEERLAAPSITT